MTNAETPPTTVSAIEQTFQQAIAHYHAGRLQEAGELYRDILQSEPGHPEANHNMGVLAVQMGQPAAGLPYFEAALDADPACGQYWLNYIDALFQAGQVEDARQVLVLAQQNGLEGDGMEALARRLNGGVQAAEPTASRSGQEAAKGKQGGKNAAHKGKAPTPQEVDALIALFNGGRLAEAAAQARVMTERFPAHWVGWKMLGVVFQQMGRNADALLPLQKAAALLPGDAETHNNLGIVLQGLDRLEEAKVSYQRALKIKPDYAQAHSNLGSTFQSMERMGEAEASYRQAIQIDPAYAKAHNNLGAVLQAQGKLDEAEASYRKALQIRPDYAEAHFNRGLALQGLDRIGEAEASYQRALQVKPDYAEAYYYLGIILYESNKMGEAEVSYRKALQIRPDYAEAHNSLGVLSHKLGRSNEAEASYRMALQFKPDYVEAHNNLGVTLQKLGRSDEAEASLRKALRIKPDHAEIQSNLLFVYNFLLNQTPASMLIEARRYGELVAQRAQPFHVWGNVPEPARCLRVGLVSGDLYAHPVGYFLEGILAGLHTHVAGQLEFHAYYNHSCTDDVTERIKACCHGWNAVAGVSDQSLADWIYGDGIDILIDLSGHTAHNRLPVFAWKPAPVQVAWLGYLATTGVAAMDYLIADPWTLPETEDAHFTEKIWRMPETYLYYKPPDAGEPVAPLPALVNGCITFGCFNNLVKVNDEVVALWAKILRAVPGSRLFLKAGQFNEATGRIKTLERFATQGIGADRLILKGIVPRTEYLALYHQVDIALDPFPYPGITTSIESLWMGVPVLTLAGESFLSRQGVGILMNAGLPEWIASDTDDYVARAILHASDVQRLEMLRKGLRQQMLASPIFDALRFARNFEAALRGIWQKWCKEHPRYSTHETVMRVQA